MRVKRRLSWVILMAILVMASGKHLVMSVALPDVYLNPPIGYAAQNASYFTDIMVRSVERLHTWQVNVTFNPAVLRFVNATEGDFLRNMPNGTWTVPPYVDNVAGFALFGWSSQGQYIGPTGSGWLGRMEFKVLSVGECVLNISLPGTKLLEYRPPPAPPGETVFRTIPSNKINGFFTNVAVPVHVEFSYSPAVPVMNAPILFNASASYANPPQQIVKYIWDFGDGNITGFVSGVNLTNVVTHSYSTAANFTVTLTVFDDTPASDLVQSFFGTTTMPQIWYDINAKVEYVVIRFGHDIRLTDVRVSKSTVPVGETVSIQVTALNNGAEVESFNVAAYYGDTLIGQKPVTNLNSADSETVSIDWDTSNVAPGVYTIKASAIDVTGDTHPEDNTKIDGTVEITASGGTTLPLMTIGAAVVVVVIVAVAAFFFMRRRSRQKAVSGT
jgi:hypothetical protein